MDLMFQISSGRRHGHGGDQSRLVVVRGPRPEIVAGRVPQLLRPRCLVDYTIHLGRVAGRG